MEKVIEGALRWAPEGGVYKDVVVGTDPVSGLSAMHGLNAIGGWTQLKTRFGQTTEVNAVIGQDTGFARDFHSLVLSPTASASQLRARNRMVVANVIFRPKSYLIVSPEYRRIWTWPINSAVNTANIYTSFCLLTSFEKDERGSENHPTICSSRSLDIRLFWCALCGSGAR